MLEFSSAVLPALSPYHQWRHGDSAGFNDVTFVIFQILVRKFLVLFLYYLPFQLATFACLHLRKLIIFKFNSRLGFQWLRHFMAMICNDLVKYRPQVYEWTVRGPVATRDRHPQSWHSGTAASRPKTPWQTNNRQCHHENQCSSQQQQIRCEREEFNW